MLLISVSSPRAGSSWYFHLTNALLKQAGKSYFDIEASHDGFLYPQMTTNGNVGTLYGHKLLRLVLISQMRGTYAVKTHEKPTRGLRILTKLGLVKSTFIYRDPRDRLASIMRIAADMRAQGNTTTSFGTITGFEDALETVVPAYAHYRMWLNHPQTLMVRYEDLRENPVAEMLRTRDFLNLNLSEADVTAAIELVDSKKEDSSSGLHYNKSGLSKYKKYLTPEQIQRVHDVMGDDIVKLGYVLD